MLPHHHPSSSSAQAFAAHQRPYRGPGLRCHTGLRCHSTIPPHPPRLRHLLPITPPRPTSPAPPSVTTTTTTTTATSSQRTGLPESVPNKKFCFTGNNYKQLQLCYFFCYREAQSRTRSTVPQLHAASDLLLHCY